MRLNSVVNRLGERERQVLRHIIAGQRQKEVARDLGLSHRTVETYCDRARKKLGARNLTELVRIALRGE